MSPPQFFKSLSKYFVKIKETSNDYWVTFSIPNDKLKKIDTKIKKCLKKQNFTFSNSYEVSVPVTVKYCVSKQKKAEQEDKELSGMEKHMIELYEKKQEFLKKGFEYWKQKRINFWNDYVNSKQTKVGFKNKTHALGLHMTNLAKIPMYRLREEKIPQITKHLEEETDDDWERWVGANYEEW